MNDAYRNHLLTSVILATLTAGTAVDTQAGTAIPSSASVPIGQSSSVPFTWSTSQTSGTQTSVTSTSGTFRDSCGGNTTLGTVSTTFSKTATIPSGTQTLFNESVLVPADIIQRARNLGVTQVGYQRTFTYSPSGAGDIACLTLNITSSAAANLGISGEILSFDNGSSVRILPRNNAIHAQAELGYNGTGLLQAVWEIAEPATSSGSPVYRPLLQVRDYLTLGDTKTLKSPALPTGTVGLYLVRLRVIDPIVPFTTPVIRYFVAEGRVGKELPPDPVGVTSPVPFALYAPDTLFAWESHKGARAYQLEVYRTDRNPATELPDLGVGDRTPKPSDVAAALRQAPVTGMLVPGNQTATTLSANARQRLIPGRAYLWRVLAISEDGTVIGQSPMREMRTP